MYQNAHPTTLLGLVTYLVIASQQDSVHFPWTSVRPPPAFKEICRKGRDVYAFLTTQFPSGCWGSEIPRVIYWVAPKSALLPFDCSVLYRVVCLCKGTTFSVILAPCGFSLYICNHPDVLQWLLMHTCTSVMHGSSWGEEA